MSSDGNLPNKSISNGGGMVNNPRPTSPQAWTMYVNDPLMASEPSENGAPVNGFSSTSGDYRDTETQRVFYVLDEYYNSENDDTADVAQEGSVNESYSLVEAMLDERLKEGSQECNEQTTNAQHMGHTYIKNKELGQSNRDLLPLGWIQITHESGVPLYVHRRSRVCTLARPFYLGQDSAHGHQIPLSAIPCLQYKRALEKEKLVKDKLGTTTNGQLPLGAAKIETVEENEASHSLDPLSIQQYCSSLFRFETVQRSVSWSDDRDHANAKAKRVEKQPQRRLFPDDTELIRCPQLNPEAKPEDELIINPNGKNYVSILHEYVQRALKKQPNYEFKFSEDPSTQFSATVVINGIRYGCGTGTSKKLAKLSAAKASLEMLIPEMRENFKTGKRSASDVEEEDDISSVFDSIKVEDPLAAEFCAKTSEPSPFNLLLTCLQRNFDPKSMHIDCKINPLNSRENEFFMTVGTHHARVICKNKKEGKQRASQAILQMLHPSIDSWGPLLRLYGNRSVVNDKRLKREKRKLTELQNKASPNHAILDKLKAEMTKLHEEMSKRKPVGVCIPPSLPSSDTQLNKVDL